MKIVFSRKGFDSGRKSGGAPSPIIDGVPYSLPIPTNDYPSTTTYGNLGLGDALSRVKFKGNLTADSRCHEDPMFWGNRCAFGQTGGAQGVLKKEEVREGDVFLFFGLFREMGSNERHHRIFGYLKIEKKFEIETPVKGEEAWHLLEAKGAPRRHSHTIDEWNNGRKWHKNNTIYFGHGSKAKTAHPGLRLTKPGHRASFWCVPAWLRKIELPPPSWHWCEDGTLQVGPGQEFVANVGAKLEPKEWLDKIIAAIDA